MLLLLLALLLVGVAAGRHVVRGTRHRPDQPPVGPVRSVAVVVPAPAPESESAFAADQSAPDLTGWDDHRLALAWRSSYLRLQRLLQAHQCAGVDAVARERGHYLDEIERRHPEGFRAWIASGARAPSDPSRYLGPRDQTRRDGQDA